MPVFKFGDLKKKADPVKPQPDPVKPDPVVEVKPISTPKTPKSPTRKRPTRDPKTIAIDELIAIRYWLFGKSDGRPPGTTKKTLARDIIRQLEPIANQ